VIGVNLTEIAEKNRKISGFELNGFSKTSALFFSDILQQQRVRYQNVATKNTSVIQSKKGNAAEKTEKKQNNVDKNDYSTLNPGICQCAGFARNNGINDIDRPEKTEGYEIDSIKEKRQLLNQVETSIVQGKNGDNSEVTIEELKRMLEFLQKQNVLPDDVIDDILHELESVEPLNIDDLKLFLEGLLEKLENQNENVGNIVNTVDTALKQIIMSEAEVSNSNFKSSEENKNNEEDEFLLNGNLKITAGVLEAYEGSEISEKSTNKLESISKVDKLEQEEEQVKHETEGSNPGIVLENEGDLPLDMPAWEKQMVLNHQDPSYKGFDRGLEGIYNRYGNAFYGISYENSTSFAEQNIKAEADIFTGNIMKEDVILQVVEKARTYVAGEKSEMLIELKPEILGKVMLKVLTENDMVKAEFYAENARVKEILESNLQMLKDALAENGYTVQEFSVTVQDQRSGNNFSFNSNARNNWGSKNENKAVESVLTVAISDNYRLAEDDITLNNLGLTGSKLNLTA